MGEEDVAMSKTRGRPRKTYTEAQIVDAIIDMAIPHSQHPHLWAIPREAARAKLGRDYEGVLSSVGARVMDSSYSFGSGSRKGYTKAWMIPVLDRELGLVGAPEREKKLGLLDHQVFQDGRVSVDSNAPGRSWRRLRAARVSSQDDVVGLHHERSGQGQFHRGLRATRMPE